MFVIMDNIMKRPVLATDCIVKKKYVHKHKVL